MDRALSATAMSAELGVLGIVSERLESAGIAFMLTGSFALTYYATLRMTRDLDFVVACEERSVGKLVSLFRPISTSKLIWARDTQSELQRRDVKVLLSPSVDVQYVSDWANRLGVGDLWNEIRNG